MEKSWEIERMFNDDIREKKRTGRGVHYRTGKGSDKAGVAGGVRFAKNNFKKYEKNSKVESSNLFDNIINFDSFSTYNKDMQREMLEEWVEYYPIAEISREMKITRNNVEKLLESFNLKMESGDEMRANKELMDQYKEGEIKPSVFRSLPADQKYELSAYYNDERGLTNEDIAKMVGFKNVGSFNSRKSVWKKEWEEVNNIERNESDMDRSKLLRGIEEEEPIPKKDDRIKKNDKQETVKENYNDYDNNEYNNSFELSFNGIYTLEQLRKKCEAIFALLDDDEEYQISVSVREK